MALRYQISSKCLPIFCSFENVMAHCFSSFLRRIRYFYLKFYTFSTHSPVLIPSNHGDEDVLLTNTLLRKLSL